METSSVKTALYLGLLILLFQLNTVISTDKLFVADGTLGQIFLAETDGDSFLASPLTPLNLTINESPIGLDYDYRSDMIYWSDQDAHTIHRSTLNRSFHEVIANGTIVPHGIVLDMEEDKVFWLSAGSGNLYRANLDGSNPEILDPVFLVPRGITISYNRRKLYITTRVSSPAIRSVNTDGTNDVVLIDTDIVSPSGIAFDFQERRLYWADDSLDKIESMNPDNSTDRIILLSVPGAVFDLFPFGLALHYEDVYFSDITSRVVIFADFPSGEVKTLPAAFSLPSEVHIYMDVCANRCLNNGSCVRSLTSVKCSCPFGFLGSRCEIDVCTNRCVNGGTCVPSERGSICICPEGFSGSKCDSGSKYAPLIFVCDEEAGAIFESSADSLDFRPLPIPNVYRPVAVAYSPEEDLIFWIDAENGTLNRAFRNGSGHTEQGSTISDLTIHTQSKLLAYIGAQTSIIFERGYNSFIHSSGYSTTGHLTSICLHPNTDLYALQNGTVPAIWRKELYSTTETIEKSSLLSPLSMAFDRHGSRLFMLDNVKGTVESCGPLGEDHQILLYYQNTEPVDVEWYGGSPLWTDDSSYRGIGFMAKRGGPSTGITSLNRFQKATGIHVYYGDAYERQAGEDCLEDEFTCNDTVCIPMSWRCDGLEDCDDELDEADCYSDEPDSIVFVTDLDESSISMATTTNLTFIKLPLTGLQTPVAVDYDPVDGIVYWTDSSAATISSARIDGTNQEIVIAGLGTPDGMCFDVQTKTIYWTDARNNTIEAVYPNGTGRHNILSDLDKPRAIIIISTNRMIYWTEWGDSPKIELCDLNGKNRQVVIDTGLGWPNGITYDREGPRIYWCDALLDKIESSDLYGSDRKLLLDSSHGTLHPFDIIFHHGTLMWTDWQLDGIGINEGSRRAWPKTYSLPGGFPRPGGFHVVEDINECESNPCMNGGSCEDEVDMFTCTCVPGYNGATCDLDFPIVDIDDCSPYPCGNGGTCTDGVNSYTCTCASGYTGMSCSMEIDECASSPCLNGATCNDLLNMYTCTCVPGYVGSTCETEINECASSPCLNPATCNDLLNMYTCTCVPDHTGTLCEIVTELEPIQILSSPTSLTINALERVEMMCSFENAIRFEWQKDNVTLPGTENQHVYTIASMTPSHIGYYRCRGEGRNQNGATVVFTDQAAIYITELSNIIIENARFNINVNSSRNLSDITSQYYQDAVEMVTNYVQTGMVESGNLEENSLYVVPSNLREGSIIANLNVYVEDNETSSFQIQQSVEDSFLTLSSRPDGILDASTVRIISTSICPNFTWVSRFGEALFAEGELNSRYNSTGRDCPFNTINAHQPVATALCVGDRISRALWVPVNNCGDFRNVTELLKEIDNFEITEDTVEEITEQVAIVTKNTGEITASDVTLVSNIATEVAAQNNSGREFTALVTSIVSNIASVDMTQLQEAEETNNAISNILMAYETQLNNVEVAEGEPFDVAEENIAVQVRSVPSEELNQGLVLSLSGNSSTDLSGSNIDVRAGGDTPSEGTSVGLIAEVSFPPEIADIALGASTGNVNNTNINIIMSVFSTPVLFFSPSLLNFSSENPGVNRTANTPVILLSVGGVVVADLDQTINLTFTALVPDYENQTCVFWDEDDAEWSSEGCRIVLEDSTTEMYTCACDHLTNFAILMDIHDVTTEYTYNILSYIGCAISTVCLLIALGTYLWNKKLRSRQTHKIFICLCATMLGLYTSFLALLVLDTARGEMEVNAVACGFLAGLIQFFVLSSIAWMGVEGFNTYLVIVQIFNTYIPNFMVKAGLAAWGIPAIIVILTGGIANTNYAREDVCFLRLWSQIGGLLIPVAVVLIANMVIFILVIRQLSKSAQIAGKVKKDKEGKREEMIERVKTAVTILVLMGLTWTTGYLLLIEAFTLVVQALFILFNSFQGLFIFILYCVRKPLVRQQWGLTCSWCDGEGTQSDERRVSSASASLSTISKFFSNKRVKKYSLGEESLTGVSNGTDSAVSASVSNPAYVDLDFGTYTKRSDESQI